MSFWGKHIIVLLPWAAAIPSIRLSFARTGRSSTAHSRIGKGTSSGCSISTMSIPWSVSRSCLRSCRHLARPSSYNIFIINWNCSIYLPAATRPKYNLASTMDFATIGALLKYTGSSNHQISLLHKSSTDGLWAGSAFLHRFTELPIVYFPRGQTCRLTGSWAYYL